MPATHGPSPCRHRFCGHWLRFDLQRIVLTCGVLVAPLLAGQSACHGEETASAAEKNLASFDYVWQAVLDTHWDPTLGGLDWEACKERYRPSLEDAADLSKTRKAIGQLLGELKQSHFAIVPREFYMTPAAPDPVAAEPSEATQENSEAAQDTSEAVEETSESPEDASPTDEAAENAPEGITPDAGIGWSGIDFRILAGEPVVTGVANDSPAAAAGVQKGAKIVQIGSLKVDELLKTIGESDAENKSLDEAIFARLSGELVGRVGTKLRIDVENADGSTASHELTLVEETGQKSQFGNLPAMPVRIETRMVADGVGYFGLNIFLDPIRVIPALGDFITQHPDMKGLIIDVRGNPGGIGAMAGGLAGWFALEKQQSLGDMLTRDAKLHFVFFKRPKAFAGKVAVLVDEQSMSTSEVFAGGLQNLGRARIFGRPSPGAALPSIIEILPNEDRFLHAFANFVLPDGEPLEGRGVIPDVPVELSRKALASGVDADIAAAVAWIEDESSSSAP